MKEYILVALKIKTEKGGGEPFLPSCLTTLPSCHFGFDHLFSPLVAQYHAEELTHLSLPMKSVS